MHMIIQLIGAFVAAIVLSIIFEVPKKLIIADGIVSLLGWLCYLLCLSRLGIVFSTFFASLLVALLANFLAKPLHAPTTVIMIPGLLSMVPGTSIYRLVYYLLLGNSDLVRHYLIETLQIAAMIVFAILIVETVFRILANIAFKKLHNSYKRQ